jgi:GRAM domain
MKTPLLAGETVIKQGGANLFKTIEAVGGKLYLTNQRLIFEAHRYNVQSGVTEIKLSEIQSTVTCWSKIFGLIPLTPNGLAVQVQGQKRDYRFVLWGRSEWCKAINIAANGRSQPTTA